MMSQTHLKRGRGHVLKAGEDMVAALGVRFDHRELTVGMFLRRLLRSLIF